LALDLLDELADLGGGCFRLFALDADERCFVLLIIEEDVENPVGQQGDADHRDEQRNVFGKQTPAGFWNRNFRRRGRLRDLPRRLWPRGKKSLHEIANPHPGHSTRAMPS